MVQSKWYKLALEVETALSAAVATYTQDIWKEEALTVDAVRVVRGVLASAEVTGDPVKNKVLSRIYKADGKIEETFGDLAVIVKIAYRDGARLEGVAFYEAKRRDWNKPNLPAAKKSQLQNMHRRLWHGHLLIFDREPAVSRMAQIAYAPWWWREFDETYAALAPVTNVFAVPIGPALQLGRFDTSLYKVGTPFGAQLVLRNLQGLDLDMEKATLAAARGYGKEKDVAACTIAVGVGEGPSEPELPEVNEQVLRPIELGRNRQE